MLSLKQRAILYSLYKRYLETGERQTFVPTKGVTTVTMRSLLKTGYIETDRTVKKDKFDVGTPSNMRITQEGIEAMKKHCSLQKDTINKLLSRNKKKLYLALNVNEKVRALATLLCVPNITITNLGYGIFSATQKGMVETFYEVYTPTETTILFNWGMRKGDTSMKILKVKF